MTTRTHTKAIALLLVWTLWSPVRTDSVEGITKSADEVFGTKKDLQIKRFICSLRALPR